MRADDVVVAGLDAVDDDVSRAAAIEQAKRLHVQTRRFDREDGESVAVTVMPARPDDDENQPRGIAIEHERLAPRQTPPFAVAHRARRDVGQVVARVGFVAGQCHAKRAVGDGRQPTRALRSRCGLRDHRRRQHRAREPTDAGQRRAEFLRDQHRLDAAEPAAAVRRVDHQPQQPQFGHGRMPLRRALGAFDVAALVRRVFARAEALHRIAQRQVVVGECEVHRGCARQNAASVACAMRLRCTSLLPP